MTPRPCQRLESKKSTTSRHMVKYQAQKHTSSDQMMLYLMKSKLFLKVKEVEHRPDYDLKTDLLPQAGHLFPKLLRKRLILTYLHMAMFQVQVHMRCGERTQNRTRS